MRETRMPAMHLFVRESVPLCSPFFFALSLIVVYLRNAAIECVAVCRCAAIIVLHLRSRSWQYCSRAYFRISCDAFCTRFRCAFYIASDSSGALRRDQSTSFSPFAEIITPLSRSIHCVDAKRRGFSEAN